MKKLSLYFILLAIIFNSCQQASQESATTVVEATQDEKVRQEFHNSAAKVLEHLKNPSKDYILAVSHRGDWRYAPENSLMAVQRCIDLGMDVVEIDVRLTKDGHLVALHDKTLDRTTNGTGLLSDMTLEEVKQLRLRNACGVRHSRQQVPTLEEIMLLTKDKIMVNLDKTEGETVMEAYEILKKTSTVDQAIFKGNDPLAVMREKYGDLMDSIIYMPKLWYDTPDKANYVKEFNESLHPVAYEMLFDSTSSPVFAEIENLNNEKVTVLAIALWDALCAGHTDELAMIKGPDAAWGWLIENGANAVMTDRPAELMEYLRNKGLHE